MKYLDTLLKAYQVRKTKAQKTAFLAWAGAEIAAMGYEARVEEYDDTFKSRNLIVGNPDTAKVIYTAHYDTQPVMPLPNRAHPKSYGATLLFQLPLLLFFVALGFMIGYLSEAVLPKEGFAAELLDKGIFFLVYFGVLAFMFFGPANKHTANDNTSGTACLMELMARLPEGDRKNAAFIFFDNEEKGLIGSKQFAKKHPELKEKACIMNLDCIGDGAHMMLVAPKKTEEEELSALKALLPEREGFTSEVVTAKVARYNSDQRSFKGGYAIAALHNEKPFGPHLKRIHTKRDNICEEKNLRYVVDMCLNLLKQKTEESTI